MKSPLGPVVVTVVLASGCAIGAIACGASINAVYEGDVRFEHCMALDESSDKKSTIQRSCWDEWAKYYTYGQTRDRVEYARRRQKQLSGESDFEETSAPVVAQRAVPEATTVLAPPPMMFADAGKSPDVDPSAKAKVEAPEPPAAACASQCRDVWTPCKQACTAAACEKTCEKTYKRCMKKCF